MRIRLPENSPVDKDGYIILPDKFSCNGWEFEKVKRVGDIAIYRKKKSNHSFWSYEVYQIQRFESYEIAGNIMPKKESICSDNLWGQFGWSYNNLTSAEKKFNNLLSLA